MRREEGSQTERKLDIKKTCKSLNISANDTVLPFLHTDLQSAATGLSQIRSCKTKLSGSLNDPANKVKIFFSLIYSHIQHTFLISFEIMRDKKRWTETGWEAV